MLDSTQFMIPEFSPEISTEIRSGHAVAANMLRPVKRKKSMNLSPLDLFPQTQRSLKNPIQAFGVGVHSGQKSRMVLRPAPANHGIVFVRTDITDRDNRIPARFDAVCDTRMCTVLANPSGVKIGTVEHVLAALAGAHIDNAIIEIDAAEIPILDGSSEPFVFLIESAGIADLRTPRRVIEILKPVTVGDDTAYASLSPNYLPRFNVDIEFQSRAIRRQKSSLTLLENSFTAVARARTFGFRHDVDALRKAGLGLGGSYDNAIVIDGDRIENPEGLRFSDEFARHKLLDAVGDISLAGGLVLGAFDGRKCGHALNNQLLRALFADPTAYRITELATPAAQRVAARS